MKEELEKYFTLTSENSLILNKTPNILRAEIRISKKMFEDNISVIFGDSVVTFGFLDIYVWETNNPIVIGNKKTKILLRLPNIITTSPTRIVTDSENDEYILEYYEEDKIIVTTKVPKQTSVVTKYFNLVMKGKLPDDIPYDEISKYFEECARINNFNMKVNSLFVDIIVATVCRDPDNVSRQFREAIKDNPRISLTKRKLMNMELIPAITSQFGAISSGNPRYGITSSIGAVRTGDMNASDDNISQIFE